MTDFDAPDPRPTPGRSSSRPGLWRVLSLLLVIAAVVVVAMWMLQSRSTSDIAARNGHTLELRSTDVVVDSLDLPPNATVAVLGFDHREATPLGPGGARLDIPTIVPVMVALLNDQGDIHGLRLVSRPVDRERVVITPASTAHALLVLSPAFLEADLERARQCFDICLQVDEYDVDAMLSMAEVCNKLDDRAAEEAYFHRVVATPGANKKALATAYSNLGVLYEGQDAEIEYYQRSIECVNDSFVPHYSLGAAYACRKEYERAIASFRRAVTLAPTPERETQALQSLYKVCVLVLQENPPPSGGQQEMMQQFVALMGQENYQKLAASARR